MPVTAPNNPKPADKGTQTGGKSQPAYPAKPQKKGQ